MIIDFLIRNSLKITLRQLEQSTTNCFTKKIIRTERMYRSPSFVRLINEWNEQQERMKEMKKSTDVTTTVCLLENMKINKGATIVHVGQHLHAHYFICAHYFILDRCTKTPVDS